MSPCLSLNVKRKQTGGRSRDSTKKQHKSVVQASRSRMKRVKACLESKLVRDEQDSKNGYYKCSSSRNEKENQSNGCTAPWNCRLYCQSLSSLRPRSKTWGREAAATVGEDGVRVYLSNLVYGTIQNTLEASEGAVVCHHEAAVCHH